MANDKVTYVTRTVNEFRVPNQAQLWRTQISTPSDGSQETVGLRKFAIKSSGAEVVTKSGFVIANDDIAPRLLRKLGWLLNKLADHLEGN